MYPFLSSLFLFFFFLIFLLLQSSLLVHSFSTSFLPQIPSLLSPSWFSPFLRLFSFILSLSLYIIFLCFPFLFPSPRVHPAFLSVFIFFFFPSSYFSCSNLLSYFTPSQLFLPQFPSLFSPSWFSLFDFYFPVFFPSHFI